MSQRDDFETCVLPHLDAGCNLARWLLRDPQAADDAVQESALRAYRYFGSLRGGREAARAWFLGIVRHTCFSLLERARQRPEQGGYEDEALDVAAHAAAGLEARAGSDPARLLERGRERAQVDAALRALPPSLREVVVLRELEGLDYAEIAQVAAIPIGTVMSRLSRARARLRALLLQAGVGE